MECDLRLKQVVEGEGSIGQDQIVDVIVLSITMLFPEHVTVIEAASVVLWLCIGF